MTQRVLQLKKRPLWVQRIFFAGWAAVLVPGHWIPAQELTAKQSGRPDAAEEPSGARQRLDAMRQRIAGITVWKQIGGERERLEAPKAALFRLVDPTREFPDGTLWTWPEKGRPAVLVTLSLLTSSQPPVWVYEFASLSDSLVEAEFAGEKKWSALRPGWEGEKFDNAPAPADSAAARLRQMRELARRFKAVEQFPTPIRSELRLLPQPVLRYSDGEKGQLDGAIFLFCHGTNPEVILTIEARLKAGNQPEWQYGLARNTISELHVTLDEREVWTQPYVEFAEAYVDGPYTAAADPIQEHELREAER